MGAAESEIGDFSAPRRIDGDGATRLVEVGALQAASGLLCASCPVVESCISRSVRLVPTSSACPSSLQAASAAGVQQFVLVTSLGTGKIGWPAGVLNLFGGVLIFKRKAEEALEASGLPYVIVRPGAPCSLALPW